MFIIIVNKNEPVPLPIPKAVPNSPNCLSFKFNSNFICLDEDDKIPEPQFNAISTDNNTTYNINLGIGEKLTFPFSSSEVDTFIFSLKVYL